MHRFVQIFFISLITANFVLAQSSVTNIHKFNFLEFNDIKELLTDPNPSLRATHKLGKTFNTIFHGYDVGQEIPDSKIDPETNTRYIRISQWNIANLDWDKFAQAYKNSNSNGMDLLKETDIFTLNSVDYDTEESDFRNMNQLFSELVDGRYIFVPEFIEASPELLKKSISKTTRIKIVSKEEKEKLSKNPYLQDLKPENNSAVRIKPEENKSIEDFKGLHGNAIISKFPIKSGRVLRLPACYDWFSEEYKLFEKKPEDRERKKAKNRAGEGTIDLIRRGGRVALIADIILPNRELITVVNTQLENRAEPQCREDQIEALLNEIKNINHPVILGVDLNNFEKDYTPRTFTESVVKFATDPEFYVKKVVNYLNPIAPITFISSITYGNARKKGDPTVKHIPLFFKNEAYGLFNMISKFKFNDGTKFDFSGEDKLENTNERAFKGFESTYEYKKLIGTGKVKVDWIFVKESKEENANYPKGAETLQELKFSKEMEEHSFHYPSTVKFML